MSLDQPKATFGFALSYRGWSEVPRWTKKAAYGGVTMLDRRFTAEAPTGKVTTELDILWPKHLPGFLSLVFFEDNEDRFLFKNALDPAMDDFDPKEKEDVTYLCATRLWRAPGQEVTVDDDVPLVQEAYDSHFLGTYVDLEVRVRDGEDRDAPVLQTFYLHGLPLLSGDFDEKEGRYWELGVLTFFVPLAKQPLFDAFKKKRAWEPGSEESALAPLGRLVLEGGRFGPPAFVNLVRVVDMWFEERFTDEDGKETEARLRDRWVAALHWWWLTGKENHYGFLPYLIKFPANPDVAVPRIYDCEFEVVGTKQLSGALPPLSRLPVPGQRGKVWIKDVVLKNPKNGEAQSTFYGKYGVETAYWRLPDGFDPSKKPVSLREVERLGPGKRWTPGDPTKLVFHVTSERERFQFVVKQLLERITLVNAHKEFFRRAYEKDKDELDTWGTVVAPVYDAFGKVKFTVNKWFGHVDPGTFEEWSAASGKFSNAAVEEAVRKSGRLDLRRTLGKIANLAWHEEQARQHMEKAWALFTSPEFQKPFLSGEYVGKNLEIHLGPAQDGTITAVPQINGDERAQLSKAKRLEEFEATYHYGPGLILFIFGNLSLNFPLLSSPPQPKDTSAAASDAANEKSRGDLKRRQEQFAAHLGARYQELLEAEAKGEFAEGLKTSVKWIGAPGKLTIWDSVTGGGLALMLYGDQEQQKLFSKVVLDLPEGKSFWKLNNDEWDKVAGEVRARAGREMAHKDNAGLSTVLGLLGQTVAVAELVRKGVKAELGSIIELADVVVGTMDGLLKLGQLLTPVYYRVAWKVVGGVTEVTELAIKGAGVAEKVSKGLGKAAAIVAIVKAGYDLFQIVLDWRNGFDLDWAKLGFKILELAAAILFFINPVVGAIVGALLLVAEMIYSWFTETSAEGMMLWWFSTPWGLPLGPVDGADPIPVSQPGRILELAADKLNPFFEDISRKLEGKPELQQIKAYFGSYFAAAAKKYDYRVVDRSTSKVIKFSLQRA